MLVLSGWYFTFSPHEERKGNKQIPQKKKSKQAIHAKTRGPAMTNQKARGGTRRLIGRSKVDGGWVSSKELRPSPQKLFWQAIQYLNILVILSIM